MKIRLSTLRKIIREVAVSPAVFKNNKVIDDPLHHQVINKALDDLKRGFHDGLTLNLTLASSGKYDEATRQLDDAAYEQIKGLAESVTEQVISQVNNSVKTSWIKAMNSVKGEVKPS
jgi:hypothetical protein